MQGLILLGAIILVGVLGNLFFGRTRIPESLFLILTGLLIGPIFGLVPREFFLNNISFFITIALIIVLLNSGLNLNLYKTLKNAGYAALFTVAVFFSTITLVTLTTTYFFDWPILHGIFLGIVGSGTTTVTITHLVEKLKVNRSVISSDTKTLLVLESIINDLTVITGASILLAITKSDAITGQFIMRLVFSEFIVSIFAGALLGMGWILLYAYKLHGNKLSYIFTVGLSFIIYYLAEYLGFNGAITVMTFSLVLGNHDAIMEHFKVRTKIFSPLDRDVFSMKKTDLEFTFLIRTFFFVLLGIIFDLSVLRSKTVLLLAAAVLLAEIVARYISSIIMSGFHESFKKAKFIRTTLVASGFTSTLVAFLSIEAGIKIENLAEIVLLLVILTTTTAIIGTWIQGHRTMVAEEGKPSSKSSTQSS